MIAIFGLHLELLCFSFKMSTELRANLRGKNSRFMGSAILKTMIVFNYPEELVMPISDIRGSNVAYQIEKNHVCEVGCVV